MPIRILNNTPVQGQFVWPEKQPAITVMTNISFIFIRMASKYTKMGSSMRGPQVVFPQREDLRVKISMQGLRAIPKRETLSVQELVMGTGSSGKLLTADALLIG